MKSKRKQIKVKTTKAKVGSPARLLKLTNHLSMKKKKQITSIRNEVTSDTTCGKNNEGILLPLAWYAYKTWSFTLSSFLEILYYQPTGTLSRIGFVFWHTLFPCLLMYFSSLACWYGILH